MAFLDAAEGFWSQRTLCYESEATFCLEKKSSLRFNGRDFSVSCNPLHDEHYYNPSGKNETCIIQTWWRAMKQTDEASFCLSVRPFLTSWLMQCRKCPSPYLNDKSVDWAICFSPRGLDNLLSYPATGKSIYLRINYGLCICEYAFHGCTTENAARLKALTISS